MANGTWNPQTGRSPLARREEERMKEIPDVFEMFKTRKSGQKNSTLLLYVYSMTSRPFSSSRKGSFRLPSKAPSTVPHAKISLGKGKK